MQVEPPTLPRRRRHWEGNDSWWFDRKAEPIDMDRWSHLNIYGDPEYGPTALDYKVLARTRVGAYEVSTVWIGIDMGMGRFFGHPPLIFESMVFVAEAFANHPDISDDMQCDRYPTEDSAMVGHREMVTLVGATLPQPDGVDSTPVLLLGNP